MTRSALIAAAVLCAAAPLAGDAAAQAAPASGQPGRTLRPFRSAEEYAQFYQRVAYVNRRRREQEPPPPPAAPPAPAEMSAAPSAANDAVTNVQTAGVDEGGIVKVSGDYLVVLRRGRLFTVRIGGDALEPAGASNAFAPGIDPQGAWYDEMLVSGSMVAVVGYSYRRSGTEIGLFRIEPDGRLTHRSTYHLRSGDYYSSRNYASRLVRGKLVFYSPVPVRGEGGTAMASLPGIRRWGAADTTFRPTTTPTRIYRPGGPIELLDQSPTLHTVTVCGIDDEALRCESTALFGPYGRVFYASPEAIYVWASRFPIWRGGGGARGPVSSVLFRMPLDGSAPTGLRVSGGPVDQMSFLESPDRHLNVLVRSDGRGDGMWGAESAHGDVALLRVPISSFGDGSGAAPAARYRRLPAPGAGPFQNRFVGDWLLYGTGTSWGRPREGGSTLHAVRWAGGGAPAALPLPHGVDRIERMGSGAVVIGSDGRDLHFSALRLGSAAVPAHRFTRANASQGETRTHGFFYRADGAERGIVGLPVVGGARAGSAQLRAGSAAVTFLRNEDFELREMGELAATAGAVDDKCKASCADWYGNARPLFLRGRIFALMGYEIVEGRDDDGRIRELRRVGFAPGAARAGR